MSPETTPDTAQRWAPAHLPEKIRHYINGEHVDSIDGDTFEVLNPVTNEPYITAYLAAATAASTSATLPEAALM